jgi:hypothetical protein
VSSAGNGVPTLSSKPSSAVEANSAAPAGGRPPQVASLKGWLEEMDLGKYAPALEAAGVGLAALPSLDDAQLIQMGIVALGARRKLLAAAGKLSQLPRVASPLAVNSATAVSSDIDDAVTSRSGPLASEGKPPVEECARVRSSLMAGHSGGRSREGATTTLAAAGAPKSAVSRLRRPPVRRPIVRIDGALLQGKDRRCGALIYVARDFYLFLRVSGGSCRRPCLTAFVHAVSSRGQGNRESGVGLPLPYSTRH